MGIISYFLGKNPETNKHMTSMEEEKKIASKKCMKIWEASEGSWNHYLAARRLESLMHQSIEKGILLEELSSKIIL